MARCTLYIFVMFMLSSFRDLLQVSGFIDIPVSFTIFNHHLIGNILLQVIMGVAWGQILRRKGVSGGKHPPNHEANDILSKENTFFVLQRVVMAFVNQYTKLI